MPASRLSRLLLSALLLVPCVRPLRAQEPPRRAGLWGSIGTGYGRLDLRPRESYEGGVAGARHGVLRLGWTLSPQWLVALELNGWQRDGGDAEATVALVSGIWYPAARGGFSLRAGIGRASFLGTHYEGPNEHARGPAVMGGVGYDVPMTRKVSVTALADVVYGHPGWTTIVDLRGVPGLDPRIRKVGFVTAGFTLGITVH